MKRFALLFIVLSLAIVYAFRNPVPVTNQETCIACHADLIDNKIVHPITETGCEFCHASNGEKHPGKKKGFEFKSTYPDMCTMCHDSKNTMSSVHSPVEEGDCSVCHDPHSSSHPSLILDLFSDNACLDCHYVETEFAESVHGPVMEGNCQECHDPHQTNHSFQLRKESKALCLDCHDEAIESGDRTFRNIASDLVKGNVIHEPIKNADCISCHTPHSGDYPYLLIGNYPVKQYAEATVEKFELCFNCHVEALLTEMTTVTGTNFRHGTKNLHYLHIQGNRGRNCNLCHNAHGAPNEHMLEDAVLFGKWLMPMGLELTENGGSCATGCHKRLEYSRVIE
jgi:predicted CXXCH cytochrome family protein